MVTDFWFQGLYIKEDLAWSVNITADIAETILPGGPQEEQVSLRLFCPP